MDVRIETIDRIQVARIRQVGSYSELGQCFEGLFQWASAIGVPTGEVLALSLDDPERVPAERLEDGTDCERMRVAVHVTDGQVENRMGQGKEISN